MENKEKDMLERMTEWLPKAPNPEEIMKKILERPEYVDWYFEEPKPKFILGQPEFHESCD